MVGELATFSHSMALSPTVGLVNQLSPAQPSRQCPNWPLDLQTDSKAHHVLPLIPTSEPELLSLPESIACETELAFHSAD